MVLGRNSSPKSKYEHHISFERSLSEIIIGYGIQVVAIESQSRVPEPLITPGTVGILFTACT